MGSSHSYLQNLASTDATPFYWVKAGHCFQVMVPSIDADKALNLAGAAGTCANNGYAKLDKDMKLNTPIAADVDVSIWEVGTAAPATTMTLPSVMTIPTTTTTTPKVVVVATTANHDDEESRYSWKVHCATAEGRAKYAYCQNPEPAAL